MHALAARLDDIGKPAWIALVVLSFILWWPLGMAALLFTIWSGRMGCCGYGRRGRWQDGVDRMRSEARRWWSGREYGSSGNRAFDEYRAETLRRLEEEQREFREFLDRLRHAKDKAEFDQFMAERRGRSEGPEPQPQP
ncbi:MAG: DUF2852 domain-containing protein [Rhodospirillaceae bacterium]|nr:DUF2852 domain-containing protein [Rhodospirillaceae bacterium]